MEDKSLSNKSITIRGNQYVQVKDRVKALADSGLEYSLTTEYQFIEKLNMFVVKATLEVEGRIFTGHSQAVIGSSNINSNAALENAETSSVGRCLALFGIGIIDSVASADEITKAFDVHHVEETKHDEFRCGDCGAEMVYKEGVSKAGKAYKGYFCPNAKQGELGHRPLFIND